MRRTLLSRPPVFAPPTVLAACSTDAKAAASILLIILMCVQAAAQSSSTQDSTPEVSRTTMRREKEGPATREEENEARELVLRFTSRLREADDFGPPVAEFFVEDFAERFQNSVGTLASGGEGEFFKSFERGVLAEAAPADLRRAYLALLNYWDQMILFHDTVQEDIEARGKPGAYPGPRGENYNEWQEMIFRDALGPSFYTVAESDPLLAVLVAYTTGKEETASRTEPETSAVRSVGRLRSFTEKLESLVGMTRDASKRLRTGLARPGRGRTKCEGERLQWVEAEAAARGLSEKQEGEYRHFRVAKETLKTERLGFPAGSTLMSARLPMLKFVLVRRGDDDRLKILGVLPND